jgi:deferrochelatase/peroxidase EfeB
MTEENKQPDLTNEQIREALTKMHRGLIIMQERLDDHEKVLEQLITGMTNIAETMAPQKGFRTPKKDS